MASSSNPDQTDPFDLLSRRQWDAVLHWTVFHPDQVSRVRDEDRGGHTALHKACLYQAPKDVIEAILYAAPEIASVPNKYGEYGIHWAVRLSASEDIVKVLLDAYPKSGISPNVRGETALSLLWDRHKKRMGEHWNDIVCKPPPPQQQQQQQHGSDSSESTQRDQFTTAPGWKQIMLLLRAFTYGTVSEQLPKHATFRPLHCAVGSPCPLSFISYLSWICPHELIEKDEYGRLPLSIAAASRGITNSAICVPLLALLLARSPLAIAIPDFYGKLPLALAIESGKTWDGGVKFLFDVEPRAVCSRDAISRLYPFMLAAQSFPCNKKKEVKDEGEDAEASRKLPVDWKTELHRVNLTFQLLRADPESVRVA